MFRLLAVLFLCPLPAAASCGAASCPGMPFAHETPSGRWASLGYEFEFTPQYEVRVLRHPAEPREVRGHHDEFYTVSRVHRAVVATGWGNAFALEARFPWVSRSHGHIHRHRGADLGESWSFDGMGDIETAARVGVVGRPEGTAGLLSLILGVKMNTGDTSRESAHGLADIGIEPGTGSDDVTVGAAWLKDAHAWGSVFPLNARVSYRMNGPGRQEYRMGNVTQAGFGAGVPVVGPLSVTAAVDLAVLQRDYKGKTSEETQKTGGEYLTYAPGLELRLPAGWTTSASVRLPLYTRVNSIQLVPRWGLAFALTKRWVI